MQNVENTNNNPGCEYPEVIVYPSLAMVYPPRQVWRELYDAEAGLMNGTIFRELDMPFYPGRHTVREVSYERKR